MTDLISRDKVQEIISVMLSDYQTEETKEALETLDVDITNLPSIAPLGKCDRCGGEIYPNTLCIECNDYLAKSVFAEEIKQEIQKILDMTRVVETESQRAQVIALSWVLELIDKHIGKEQE